VSVQCAPGLALAVVHVGQFMAILDNSFPGANMTEGRGVSLCVQLMGNRQQVGSEYLPRLLVHVLPAP
jgi:hypothetical protein